MDSRERCRGGCCRNPWGVCYHERDCAHHRAADAALAEKQRQADAVADLERAAHQARHMYRWTRGAR